MARGALILIEGLDRAGKTTQTTRLVQRLEKEECQVELIKFPDRTTPIGQLINTYLVDKSFQLSDESAHLLFSANRWELAQVINAKLEEGINIVLDRYVYSGVAYTSAKGLDRQWCLNPDLGLPKPDLTVFLNLEDRESRAGFGEERYEVSDFQKKVELQFRQFFDEENWNTLVVDGKGIAEVESEVWELVQEVLSNELQEIKTF